MRNLKEAMRKRHPIDRLRIITSLLNLILLIILGEIVKIEVNMITEITEITVTTETTTEETQICITKYGSIDIVGTNTKHKYLGRAFVGDLSNRSKSAVDHRLGCAWMKYKTYQHVLENKDVSLNLRLKLFKSIISPTVCYSLDTCPLTENLKNRLDITQRVMLRRMIGWVSFTGDTWEERGRRMKGRLERALANCPVEKWSTIIHGKKLSLMSRVSE